MLIGIDTCVFVYFVDKSNPYHREAKATLERLIAERRAALAPQNLGEFISVVTRHGVPLEHALERARDFRKACFMVFPNAKTLDLFEKLAVQASIRGHKVFDAFLAATYLSNGITTIYTYNTKDFERLGAIKVWKP